MTTHIPTDPAILLSYVNTQLRNHYPTFDELCASMNLDQAQIIQKLESIGYVYNSSKNQFQ